MATEIIINEPKTEILKATANEIELKLTFTIANPTMTLCKLTITAEENFFEKMDAVGNNWVCYVKLTSYDYPIKNCMDIKATVTNTEKVLREREFCLYQLKFLNENTQGFLDKVNEITEMIAKNGLTLSKTLDTHQQNQNCLL